MTTTIYVDVSHHDWDRHGGQLDWAKVRAATSPVMCARATYGDTSGYHPITRHFADFQRGAAAAGFTVRGGYHNLIHGDAASMKRQVAWFRQQLDAESCDWAMVDVERYSELVSNGLWPRWDDVRRWRDAWYAVEDRPMAWYLPAWLVNNYYSGADLTELPGPLVQSHYAAGDGTAAQIYAATGADKGTGWDDRYGGRTCDIWQYSSNANVAGASSQTDVNAYRGSVEALAALLTGDDMADTAGDTALQYRMLSLLALDPKFASAGAIVPEGRMASVPLIDLLVRLDANVKALAGADWVDEQSIADAVLAKLAGLTPEAIAARVLEHLSPEVAAQVVAAMGAKLTGAAA